MTRLPRTSLAALALATGVLGCRSQQSVATKPPLFFTLTPSDQGTNSIEVAVRELQVSATGSIGADGTATLSIAGKPGSVVEIAGTRLEMPAGSTIYEIDFKQEAEHLPLSLLPAPKSRQETSGERSTVFTRPFTLTLPDGAPQATMLTLSLTEESAQLLARRALREVARGRALSEGQSARRRLLWFDGSDTPFPERIGDFATGATLADVDLVAITTWDAPERLGTCTFPAEGHTPAFSLQFQATDAHVALYDARTGKKLEEQSFTVPHKCPSRWTPAPADTVVVIAPSVDGRAGWLRGQLSALEASAR